MKKSVVTIIFCVLLATLWGCQPKNVTPIDGLIGKIWKAKSVKEGTTVVYTEGRNQ